MQEMTEFKQPQLSNGTIDGTSFAIKSKEIDNCDWQVFDNNDYTFYDPNPKGSAYFSFGDDWAKYKGTRTIKLIKLYYKGKLVFRKFIKNKKFYNDKHIVKIPSKIGYIDNSEIIVRTR